MYLFAEICGAFLGIGLSQLLVNEVTAPVYDPNLPIARVFELLFG